MSKRVLLAGIFHETHTFLEETTPLDKFATRQGEELLTARGDGSPLSGALAVADEAGWEVIPIIDLRATPSGTVDDDVVEVFWEAFQTAAEREIPNGVDGIFLILHGAMASQSIPDVEGELIQRIHQLPGAAEIPICGVLDLHGNISRPTVELTQGLIAYRCNPHIDSREACMNGAKLLERIMTTGEKPVSVWNHPPIMWPPTGTGTADDPMKMLESMARDIEQSNPEIVSVNVFGGFSFADTPDTGVCFTAVTFGNPAKAQEKLQELSRWSVENRETGNVVDAPLAEKMPDVLRHIEAGETPVVIVEPADNIGGGGPGDATTILRTFVEHHIENSAVVINDPEAVEKLHELTVGECVTLAIGGKSNRMTAGPIELEVELLSKSDGKFDLEDRNSHLASMCGIHIEMGPSATVKHQGVYILLTSQKTPPFDLGQLRSQGIEPEAMSVIGVKAAVAHRRAFEKIQKASYTIATPGPCSSDLKTFPFEKIDRPIFPLDD